MLGEVQAITRNPPGGSSAVPAGNSNTYANAQSLSLVAATPSAVTPIFSGTAPTVGAFVTFKNIGTAEARIRFGTVAGGPGTATVADFPISAGGSEEWWVTSEINFTAISSAAAVISWYRSSN